MDTYTSKPKKKFDRKEYCKQWRSKLNPEWHKKHYLKNRERTLAYQRAQRINDPRKRMYTWIKSSAKKNNVPFDITIDDIIIPKVCPVLGIPIVLGESKRSDNSPSLDKFVPELGYVKGNINVISWRANRLKNNGTPEEFRRLVKWMDGID